MSADVPGLRARLGSPASAGVVFVFTVVAAAASLPLAVLARQAAGNVVIFRAGVALLALVLGSVGWWWRGTSRVIRWDGCCWAQG